MSSLFHVLMGSMYEVFINASVELGGAGLNPRILQNYQGVKFFVSSSLAL